MTVASAGRTESLDQPEESYVSPDLKQSALALLRQLLHPWVDVQFQVNAIQYLTDEFPAINVFFSHFLEGFRRDHETVQALRRMNSG